MCFTVFDFELPSTSASHLACAVIMGFQRQLSVRLLRVDVHGCTNVAGAGSAGATSHSMITVLAKWEPLCFSQGRSCCGGLFWVLFVAVDKEYLACGAKTAMP